MKYKIMWFARGGGVAKMGPFHTQIEATDHLRLNTAETLFPSDAFVWPERTEGFFTKPRKGR